MFDFLNPATGGAGGGRVRAPENPTDLLVREGPQVPSRFIMSSFSVLAFVRGSLDNNVWRLILDFKLSRPGLAWIEVSEDNVQPFYYRLNGNITNRQQVIFTLPWRFGLVPHPGIISIRAVGGGQGEVAPIAFNVYGLAAGPRGVGSVNIDRFSFQPPTIHPRHRQNATYAFESHTELPLARVEIEKVDRDRQGVISINVVKHEPIHGSWPLNPGTFGPRTWNGYDDSKTVSPGVHLIQVRAWNDLAGDGDWIVGWSDEQVEVVD